MKKLSMVIFVFVLFASFQIISAENTTMDKGYLYINGVLIEKTDTVLAERRAIFLPLRTIFETLGATVDWREDTGNVIITYKEESYICYIKEPNPGYLKLFYVKNQRIGKHLYLTAMSTGGGFCIINDRIYLYEQTGERLLEALGCKVEIDSNMRIVEIYNM